MSDRKNLEQLFQEKLEHFEVAPPEELWSTIEMELTKEKDKKRIVPFWWKFSGVAALLAIGFFVGMNFSENDNEIDSNSNPVVTTSSGTSTESSEKSGQNNSKGNDNSENNASRSEVANVNPSTENSVETTTNGSVTSGINPSNNSVAAVNPSKEKSKSGRNKVTKNAVDYGNKRRNDVATNSINNKNQKAHKIVNNNESVVDAVNYKSSNNNTNKSKENVGNPIENKSNPQHNQVTLINKNNGQDDKIAMKNHTDVVLPKGDSIKRSDSAPLVNVEPNAMEELLKEKEKQSAQKQKINRWQVTPNLAPIYFGSFAEGSPLDEMLAENNKTYNTSLSYGVGVNYAVNKKLKVRTAVNVLSVDYNTQGIVFYQDTNAKTMANVSPTQLGSMIQIKPLNSVEMQLDRVISERFDGVLNQKMGYIEMPVEMSYKILDKKFGVELVGGFSTLFLSANEIFLKTDDGLNMKIGKATNLNDIHFSSNFGIGLNYKLLKNFDARVEPTFKYQLNTFSSDSGSFKPYIFGIYSGVSYRF